MSDQMDDPTGPGAGGGLRELTLRLSIAEANLILEALGGLPYVRVFELVGKIQRQATEQARRDNGGAASDRNLPDSDPPLDPDPPVEAGQDPAAAAGPGPEPVAGGADGA